MIGPDRSTYSLLIVSLLNAMTNSLLSAFSFFQFSALMIKLIRTVLYCMEKSLIKKGEVISLSHGVFFIEQLPGVLHYVPYITFMLVFD